ncbi:hypothetical protein ACEYYB_07735 [Paracoccus sp. p4-l81]|uniref:hypothetical protein n=1 Tax=unclassified Paracoccus (in: a-proteobacteria) TaxID=2688777 RepID=UPI0035BA81F2
MTEALTDLPTEAPLFARYLPGLTRRLVVAFSGVGTPQDPVPAPEFFYSASDGGQNHVLFVADASRSWLTAPGLAERIVDLIRDMAARISAESILLLGNSMGAFMALNLGALMRPDFILGFVPQVSADPARVPEERRWMRYRSQISDWSACPEVPDLRERGIKVVILHGNQPEEAWHWRRFPAAGGTVFQFIYPRAGHGLAGILKSRGQLRPMVRAAAAGRLARVRDIARAAGGVPRGWYETHHPVPHSNPGAAAPVQEA